jgi:hypothetical protein
MKDSTSTIVGPNHQTGQVSLKFSKTPSGISLVTARLSRQGFTDRTLTLTVSDSGQAASGSFSAVASGIWHLRVDASDGSGAVLFSGETDVDVLSGQTSQVSLELLPATGGIDIVVTWGSGRPPDFSDNFNAGNANNWTFKTGAWNFIDSEVQTGEVPGHHFLMLPAVDFRDFEFQADVMKTSEDSDPEHPALVFRWGSDTTNYVFRINGVGSQSWIQLMRDMDNRDANAQYIHTEPWLASDSTRRMGRDVWYTMKLNANGDHIRCKIWKRSDAEPDGWIIDLQDATYTHGLIGLEYYTGRHRFDNVVVRRIN